jgi:hypothetical protein
VDAHANPLPHAEAFRDQAEHFAANGSPLYAELARHCAREPLVGELLDDWSFRAPLKLFAAIHYLVLSGELAEYPRDPAGLRAVLRTRRDWLARRLREQPVQTNEVQRSWALLPGFLRAARELAGEGPVDLIELGPSAGLNLCWDRYRYRYGAASWGSDRAELVLEGECRGGPPHELLSTPVVVRRRVGIDESPVDLASDEGARLLESFVWFDQTARRERLRQAIHAARRGEQPEILAGDYVDLLPELLAARDRSALTIVFHSATTNYLSDEGRNALDDALGASGEEGALARVSLEVPRDVPRPWHCYALDVQTWPGGCRRLADVRFHAGRLEWVA